MAASGASISSLNAQAAVGLRPGVTKGPRAGCPVYADLEVLRARARPAAACMRRRALRPRNRPASPASI